MVKKSGALYFLLVFVASVVYADVTRTRGLIFRDSTADCPGYTLFAPMPYNVASLIDTAGMLVHSWWGSYKSGLSVNLCPNGLLLRTCQGGNPVFLGGGGSGGRAEMVDWDGVAVWAFDYSSSTYCQHHDAIMLPNGNILMIVWDLKSRDDAIAAGRGPNLLVYNTLWPDHLIEVMPGPDSVVWEWHVWHHLVQDYDSTKANYGDPWQHPELIDLNYVAGLAVADWNHCNSIAYNPALDQIVISSRQFSEIWVIDHSTTREEARGHSGGRYCKGGDLLDRWGNPQTYRRQEIISQTLFGQHDAQWIKDGLGGAGHFLAFNNGYGRIPNFSPVDEFVPPIDSPGFYHIGFDSAFGPAAPLWQYAATPPASMYSSLISGCERLINGNTLVCDGLRGTIFEVTPNSRCV
ncbi:MAG: aryl-sulfate sulfotransferase [bacterium]